MATPQSTSASAGLPAWTVWVGTRERMQNAMHPTFLFLFGVVCQAGPKRILNGCGGHSLDSAGWVGWQKRDPIEMVSIKKSMITLHLCWSSKIFLLWRPHSKTRVIRRVVGLDSPKLVNCTVRKNFSSRFWLRKFRTLWPATVHRLGACHAISFICRSTDDCT